MPKFPAIIFFVDWVIVAVGKEILIPAGFVRGRSYHGGGIRIDKPSPGGVIIPAVQVVQARLGVIDVPAIAQGVCSAEGGGHSAVGGHGRTPGVIDVGHHLGAAGVHKTGNVALGVLQIEILDAIMRHGRRASGVVGKMQLVAARRTAAPYHSPVLTQRVVGKVQLVAAPCHLRQPRRLFPLVGFLILQVRRYFPAPQAFKFDLIMK